jgi:aminoglycoside phosphotransferase (APT) family kinase protein
MVTRAGEENQPISGTIVNHTAILDDLAIVMQVVQEILPTQQRLTVERVQSGISTAVYRIDHLEGGPAPLYLRVLPEPGDTFAPEVYVHTVLRGQQLHVPDVLHYEPCNPRLQRSIMLTTAIPGQPLGDGLHSPVLPRPQMQQVVQQAGRELAMINRLTVDGFGWVRRDATQVEQLQAEHPRCAEWLAEEFDEPLAALNQHGLFSRQELHAISDWLAEAKQRFGHPAVLAHGDFDATHIFHQAGWYTGIIDFGEIRGAHPGYDLGHFWIENVDLLPYLLAGYAEVTPLSPDIQRTIYITGLLVAARRVGRRAARGLSLYPPDRAAIQRALLLLA